MFLRRFLCFLTIISFLPTLVILPARVQAQPLLGLPEPGAMVKLSPAFEPVLIKGLKVHPEHPFRLDFILDNGSLPPAGRVREGDLKAEAQKLIKYFLAAMTIPEKDLWVNLSPYEKDRLIAPNLGETEMGRDMLAQDYILKQLTASLIYPEKGLGKTFWDKVYAKAQHVYGSTEIPVNTFNKVWIVADKADVFERGNVAYVVGARLKVMLEEDYLALQKSEAHNPKSEARSTKFETNSKHQNSNVQNNNVSSLGNKIIRDVILPEIENEVNHGKNFAPLRQMFYSMILASWYKTALKDALLTQIYGNQSKVKVGVNQTDPKANEEIFNRYLQAYKKGVFNYIKEDLNGANNQATPRKYFSGGTDFAMLNGAGTVLRHLQTLPPGSAVTSDRAVLAGVTVTTKQANAAMETDVAAVGKIVTQLQEEDIWGQMNALFGMDIRGAEQTGNKLAAIAFDGQSNRLGWGMKYLEWLLDFKNAKVLDNLVNAAKAIRNRYKYVVFAGMGGSGLSVATVVGTFGERSTVKGSEGILKRIYSLRSTDPVKIKDILEDIRVTEGIEALREVLEHVLIVLVSKSWTTAETLAHKKYFEVLYAKYSFKMDENVLFLTDPGSPLDQESETNDSIRRNLRYIQLNGGTDVGGRFTAPLTNVFLLPLALVASDRVRKILARAQEMNVAGTKDITQDSATRLGAWLYYMAKERKQDKVTFFLPKELESFGPWVEQLIEESLGKEGKGITIFYGERLNPQVLANAKFKDRIFINVTLPGVSHNTELVKSLVEKRYPMYELALQGINDLGGLMLGFQRAVTVFAYLWGINPFTQPGVQKYKAGTNRVMSALKPGEDVQVPADWQYVKFNSMKLYYSPLIQARAFTQDELVSKVESLGSNMSYAPAVYAAILRILDEKGIGFEVAELASFGKMSPGFEKILEEAQFEIFTNRLRIPSKRVEAPDKLHSFQQNIAEGKNMFFSTSFLPLWTTQPQELPFDLNLLKAQAIGTTASLMEEGRKAVLITLDGTIKNSEGDTFKFFKKVIEFLNIKLDAAMQTDITPTRALTQASSPGGIDLNRANMLMNRHKEGAGVEMTFDPAIIQRIKRDGFDGLEFRIDTLVPIANLPLLLGLRKEEQEEEQRVAGA